MKVYLDICCLKRPFDDQSQARIALETEALLLILQAVAQGELEAVRSAAHDVENARNPDTERAATVAGWLDQCNAPTTAPPALVERAAQFRAAGLKGWDAFHLAWAEHLHADVFLTTDDRLLSFCRTRQDMIRVQVLDPIAFARECC